MKKCSKCVYFDTVGGANVLSYICRLKWEYTDFEIIRAMFCKEYKNARKVIK